MKKLRIDIGLVLLVITLSQNLFGATPKKTKGRGKNCCR